MCNFMICLDAILARSPWYEQPGGAFVADDKLQLHTFTFHLFKQNKRLSLHCYAHNHFFNLHIHDYITQMLITTAKTLSATTKLDWSFFLFINSCVQLY